MCIFALLYKTHMILKYKVSLPNIKGFYRVYEVKDTTSLYFFHKQMRADMDFPQDQTILFKAVDAFGQAIARYSVIDLGAGTIDSVTLGDCHKAEQDSFVYFYDTTNVKSVLLDFVEEVSAKPRKGVVYPILVDTKGPNPIEFENGYVAYEDLPADKRRTPDDDDFDEDDDDLDDENEDDDIIGDDNEEIYDENE